MEGTGSKFGLHKKVTETLSTGRLTLVSTGDTKRGAVDKWREDVAAPKQLRPHGSNPRLHLVSPRLRKLGTRARSRMVSYPCGRSWDNDGGCGGTHRRGLVAT